MVKAMKTRWRRNIGFFVACGIIVAICLSSNVSIRGLIKGSTWVSHTLEVENTLQKLHTLIMTAQTNLRGYHLTFQDFYWNRYRESLQQLDPLISRLKELTDDNPVQAAEVRNLNTVIQTRVARWEIYAQLRRDKGLAIVQEKMRGEEGKKLDTAILDSIERLRSTEDRLLDQRISLTQGSAQRSLALVWIGGFCALTIILIAVYMVNRDEKRRAEAEEERDRFFTTSLDMLCISGMDGKFKRLSPAFEEVLGYSLSELYRMPAMSLVHPDDVEKTRVQIERQSQGERVMSFENRWRCKDGSYRHLSWKSVPAGDLMYGAARDVTLQKKFEMELVEAQIASQQAVRVKSEFLANMSHEIRTPLNGIIGMTDILMGTRLSDDQKRFSQIIQSSGTSLLRIINEILDLSKIEAGKLELETLEFEMNFLVENQKSLVGPLALQKKLALETSIDNRLPHRLRGDSSRIGQVLLNLLSNAIKFTTEGKVVLRVDLESRTETECRVKFSVKDSGIGLTDEQKQKLFLPFTQGDGSTARKYGGTGLGLSISKRLCELMGGTIGVDSLFGHGATFWFSVPLQIAGEETVPAPVAPKVSVPSQTFLRILVAEDNLVNQMIVEAMIRKLGHTVQTVGNGKEAIEAYSKSSYDLILMDHHMPEMDGMEATKIIRSSEPHGQHIPIIAFTANVMEEDQKLCLEAGMDDVILKPVTAVALQTALEKWTGQEILN